MAAACGLIDNMDGWVKSMWPHVYRRVSCWKAHQARLTACASALDRSFQQFPNDAPGRGDCQKRRDI